MADDHLSRREALRAAAGAGAALTALTPIADAAAAEPARRSRRIMLIRHGEKPDTGPPLGVLASGDQDFQSLTVRGWTRAGALTALFDPAHGKPRAGLNRPTALFASNPGAAGSKRPLQTVTPLAERLGLPVRQMDVLSEESADVEAIALALMATPGSPLGSFQHHLIPQIAKAFGTVIPAVPAKWPGDRYDVVWVFTRRSAKTWRFNQVPQRLLAGDKKHPIR